jgi:hypothetical protein
MFLQERKKDSRPRVRRSYLVVAVDTGGDRAAYKSAEAEVANLKHPMGRVPGSRPYSCRRRIRENGSGACDRDGTGTR